MDDQQLKEIADEIYYEVYGHIDSKSHARETKAEIYEWLAEGDTEGVTIEQLVEWWKEYAAT